jgi:hypothetical protein
MYMEQLLIGDIGLTFNRQNGRFMLAIGKNKIQQNVCEFLHTMSFLVGKDIEEHLMNTDSRFDTVRVPLTNAGKTVTLDLKEFIQFREAYGRQMFLLKLEDLLLRKGIQSPKLF